jgi:hypothetical protein
MDDNIHAMKFSLNNLDAEIMSHTKLFSNDVLTKFNDMAQKFDFMEKEFEQINLQLENAVPRADLDLLKAELDKFPTKQMLWDVEDELKDKVKQCDFEVMIVEQD